LIVVVVVDDDYADDGRGSGGDSKYQFKIILDILIIMQ